MKEKLLIFIISLTFTSAVMSQSRIIMPTDSTDFYDVDSLGNMSSITPPFNNENMEVEIPFDTINVELPAATVWHIDPRSGDRIIVPMDTLKYNFQQTMLADGSSVANGYTGTIGSPTISKIFFENEEEDIFPFNNAHSQSKFGPTKQVFYNTRVPYAKLDYQTAGSRPMREQRLDAVLTSNFSKSLNVAIEGTIIDAKGLYKSQGNKHNNWSIFSNYLSDKFQAHLYAGTSTIKHFENGGITNDSYITDPESIGQSFQSIDIPVRFDRTWNKLATNQIFFSGKYNLGYYSNARDTLSAKQFIPVASLILTSQYLNQHRRFLSYDTTNVNVDGLDMQYIDQYYPNRYYDSAVDDSTTFRSIKNTLALSLNEGFKPWVKFGLTGFIEHDLRKFTMIDEIDGRMGRSSHTENSVFIGGILNKQQGEFLQFNIRADIGVLGADLGQFKLEGDVETRFDIVGKQTSLSGHAYIKNLTPNYLQNNYHSKYFWWNKDFGDSRRVFVGGKLYIPFTKTTISAGVENIQNHIYFDKNRSITQNSDNVQVLMAKIDQRIKLGIFNWDNEVVYQTSSNQDIVPIPTLSVYSNMYLKALIAKELTLQLGVDAHYHTKYYAPGYEPALLQFYNQKEKEIGNYPIATVYANMHLKQTRFFVMFYNVGTKVFKSREYFSLPNYPVNPFMLKLGLSVDLHN